MMSNEYRYNMSIFTVLPLLAIQQQMGKEV